MLEPFVNTDRVQKTKRLKNGSSSDPKSQRPTKRHRKGGNPAQPLDARGSDSSRICKNYACRAVLTKEDSFCKRCSCCVCHLFDDNKDPSLWLECMDDFGQGDFCGSSCHIECAFQCRKVGVVNLVELLQLDGSYCCASCGKISGILGYWKKQLSIAKDARRVDVLCYRIQLCYRLLDGTSRFKDLHQIVIDTKTQLEKEVGPLSGVASKIARGIVSRLRVAVDVQKLCLLAMEKADEWFGTYSVVRANKEADGSLPAACRVAIKEVTSSSVVLEVLDLPPPSLDLIKGHKLWYCKTLDEPRSKDPAFIFPTSERSILISNLQELTEYSFRIVSFTETGDLDPSEAKCCTNSAAIVYCNCNANPSDIANNLQEEDPTIRENHNSGADNRLQDLGEVLCPASTQENHCQDFGKENYGKLYGTVDSTDPKTVGQGENLPPKSLGLDLNVVSIPDLNEELGPQVDLLEDEDHALTPAMTVLPVKPDITLGVIGNEEPENGVSAPIIKEAAAGQYAKETSGKGDNLFDSVARVGSGLLDDNFEHCVKSIRWLECEGHIKKEFRLKLLTWFSLRSTEQQRRVVNTYIRALIGDPSSLASQLVDSFSEVISAKTSKNGP